MEQGVGKDRGLGSAPAALGAAEIPFSHPFWRMGVLRPMDSETEPPESRKPAAKPAENGRGGERSKAKPRTGAGSDPLLLLKCANYAAISRDT